MAAIQTRKKGNIYLNLIDNPIFVTMECKRKLLNYFHSISLIEDNTDFELGFDDSCGCIDDINYQQQPFSTQ